MSTALTPYRDPGIVVVEPAPKRKTGLILGKSLHSCSLPKHHEYETVKPFLFFFTRTVIIVHDLTENSLYCCPDCYRIYRRDKDDFWVLDNKATDMWNFATGESATFIDRTENKFYR